MRNESFYPIWYVKEKRELMKQTVRVIFLINIFIVFAVGYFTFKNYNEYRELCAEINNRVEDNLSHEELDTDSIKVINKIIFINKLFVENSLELTSLEFVENRLSCKIQQKEKSDFKKVIEKLEENEGIELIEVSFIKENNINLILSME